MPPTLGQEIGKKDPFDLPEEEAYLNLVRTTNQLGGAIKALFKDHGLSEATYNVLRIVRAGKGKTCSEIGRDMVVRVPDVTRLVDRLEGLGLVTRSRGSEDRRVVRIAITREGQRLLQTLDKPLRALHVEQMAPMTKAELKELSRLLVKLRATPV